MIFEERLQQALAESGLSQSELGRRVGVNSQSVSGWVGAGIFPRKDKLELLPEALGKPLYWFFMTDEELQKYEAAMTGVTDLDEDEKALIEVYRQFPSLERRNMLAAFSARLKEVDEYFNELAKLKGIDLDKNKK